jgi:hypothetical protein
MGLEGSFAEPGGSARGVREAEWVEAGTASPQDELRVKPTLEVVQVGVWKS